MPSISDFGLYTDWRMISCITYDIIWYTDSDLVGSHCTQEYYAASHAAINL